MPVAIRGFLEFASVSSVRGWAYDSDAPSVHLEVVVRADNEVYGSTRADIQRHDLAAAGIGDGSHGFNIDLTSAHIPAGAVSALEVYVVSGADTVKLFRIARTSNRNLNLRSDGQIPIADDSQFPVIILGPARSGTSVVTLGLLDSSQYEGIGEGHLLPLTRELLNTIDMYYQRHADNQADTMLGRVPSDAFQKLVRRSFVQLARDLFPTGHWLDKTPTVEMVRAAPLMRELWPNARFIFMKRRVIENVLSRQRKFPHDTTDMHYSDWVAVMSAWLAVRTQLVGAALEIEHRHLVLDPCGVASEISDFLQMRDEPSARLSRFLGNQHPEQTDDNFGAVYNLEQLGLSEDEAKRMIAKCDPLMAAYGYSYSESYFYES
jgi:Sulfotransferase family